MTDSMSYQATCFKQIQSTHNTPKDSHRYVEASKGQTTWASDNDIKLSILSDAQVVCPFDASTYLCESLGVLCVD